MKSVLSKSHGSERPTSQRSSDGCSKACRPRMVIEFASKQSNEASGGSRHAPRSVGSLRACRRMHCSKILGSDRFQMIVRSRRANRIASDRFFSDRRNMDSEGADARIDIGPRLGDVTLPDEPLRRTETSRRNGPPASKALRNQPRSAQWDKRGRTGDGWT